MKLKITLLLVLAMFTGLACTHSLLPKIEPGDSTVTIVNDLPDYLLTMYSVEILYNDNEQETIISLFEPKTGYTIEEGESVTFGYTNDNNIKVVPWNGKDLPGKNTGAYLKMVCKIVAITPTGAKMINARTPVYIPITIDYSPERKHITIKMSEKSQWKTIDGSYIRLAL